MKSISRSLRAMGRYCHAGPFAMEARRVTEFMTTTEIVRAAQAALEPQAWDYIVGGSETEMTLRRNREAIEGLAFRARVLRDVRTVDTSTRLLGTKLAHPVHPGAGRFAADDHARRRSGASARRMRVRHAAGDQFGTEPVARRNRGRGRRATSGSSSTFAATSIGSPTSSAA